MKELFTAKNIFIFALAIYAIIRFEMFLSKDNTNTSEIVQHMKEKEQMNKHIDSLNKQIQKYEIKILQKHLDIDNMSDSDIDSTWSTIFR